VLRFGASHRRVNGLLIPVEIKILILLRRVLLSFNFIHFSQAIKIVAVVHRFVELNIAVRAIVIVRQNLLVPKFKLNQPIVLVFILGYELIDFLHEFLRHKDVRKVLTH
jgi:hypothetical protein